MCLKNPTGTAYRYAKLRRSKEENDKVYREIDFYSNVSAECRNVASSGFFLCKEWFEKQAIYPWNSERMR